MDGIIVTGGSSPYNMELEIDTDLLELNQFIKEMNENFIITDLVMGSRK